MNKIACFDFDNTLYMIKNYPNYVIINLLLSLHKLKYDCYIVTARNYLNESDEFQKKYPTRMQVEKFVKLYNLPIKKIIYNNHNPKGPILAKLNCSIFFDDKDEELDSARKYGIQSIKCNYLEEIISFNSLTDEP